MIFNLLKLCFTNWRIFSSKTQSSVCTACSMLEAVFRLGFWPLFQLFWCRRQCYIRRCLQFWCLLFGYTSWALRMKVEYCQACYNDVLTFTFCLYMDIKINTHDLKNVCELCFYLQSFMKSLSAPILRSNRWLAVNVIYFKRQNNILIYCMTNKATILAQLTNCGVSERVYHFKHIRHKEI